MSLLTSLEGGNPEDIDKIEQELGMDPNEDD